MDQSASIEFTLFAVNGAGKGNVSKPFQFKKESGLCISAIFHVAVAAYFFSHSIPFQPTHGHHVLD